MPTGDLPERRCSWRKLSPLPLSDLFHMYDLVDFYGTWKLCYLGHSGDHRYHAGNVCRARDTAPLRLRPGRLLARCAAPSNTPESVSRYFRITSTACVVKVANLGQAGPAASGKRGDQDVYLLHIYWTIRILACILIDLSTAVAYRGPRNSSHDLFMITASPAKYGVNINS